MRKYAFFLFMALALPPGLAASAGEGAVHIDWFNVLGKVVNSTLLFGGLILLLRKPLINMLAQKSSAVRDDIVEREKELAATEARLQDIRERLARVAAEVEEIKSSAGEVGRDELARLEAAGKQEAGRIIALSEEEIHQRVEAAVRTVKERIADLAIARFKNDFEKDMDTDTQQKIIERNIDACGDLDEGK